MEVFVTCGSSSGESIGTMRKVVEARGMLVTGTTVFIRRDLRDETKVNSLMDLMKQACVPWCSTPRVPSIPVSPSLRD